MKTITIKISNGLWRDLTAAAEASLMPLHDYCIAMLVASVPQRCRVCGCTDDDCRQCIEKTGEPCSWAEPDLCSACVPAAVPR